EDEETSEDSETQAEESPPAPGELIQQSPLPIYPKDLVGGSETGKVIVEASVSEDGEVQSVSVIESSGIESMDRNAQSTVENGWSFRSYNKSYIMEIEVIFEVDERDNPVIDVDLLDLKFE
ncbi:MAG: TonB family protein, partial [Bacillota bacterium]